MTNSTVTVLPPSVFPFICPTLAFGAYGTFLSARATAQFDEEAESSLSYDWPLIKGIVDQTAATFPILFESFKATSVALFCLLEQNRAKFKYFLCWCFLLCLAEEQPRFEPRPASLTLGKSRQCLLGKVSAWVMTPNMVSSLEMH